jgi:hypothetical protein
MMNSPVTGSRKPRLYIDAASFDPQKVHKNDQAVILVVQNAEGAISKWIEEKLSNASAVVVLDIGSSDATPYLAAEAGAVVILQEKGVSEEDSLCLAIDLAQQYSANIVFFRMIYS